MVTGMRWVGGLDIKILVILSGIISVSIDSIKSAWNVQHGHMRVHLMYQEAKTCHQKGAMNKYDTDQTSPYWLLEKAIDSLAPGDFNKLLYE